MSCLLLLLWSHRTQRGPAHGPCFSSTASWPFAFTPSLHSFTSTSSYKMRALTLSPLFLALKATGALAGKANTFEIVGHTGVSAQQLFLGNEKKVSRRARGV